MSTHIEVRHADCGMSLGLVDHIGKAHILLDGHTCPEIPPEVCGFLGCVLTPHPLTTQHSWEEPR